MSSSSSPPLFLLWRLKLKGRVRLLARKARTFGGAVSLLVGAILLVLWIVTIILRSSYVERTVDPPSMELVRLGLLAYLGFVAFSSLSFRGVYMPRPELERLFAAPVPRRSIVRFRMLGAMLMALPFTVIVALFLSPRFASPWAAALGLAVTIPATSIFGQALSLLAAKTGGLGDRILSRFPATALRVIGALGILGLFTFLSFGPGIQSTDHARSRRAPDFSSPRSPRSPEDPDDLDDLDGEVLGVGGGTESGVSPWDWRSQVRPSVPPPPRTAFQRVNEVASSRPMRIATFPLTPWARAIASPSVPAALPWLASILGLLVLLFEAVARMPIDFRESSLRTSQDMERKLARMRSGQGGAGVFGQSSRAKGWRIPWLAGRSPMGAVIWVRTAWLIRQARGTLLIVAVVAIAGVVVGVRVFDQPGSGPATLALLATVYLASGIRADFRTDLDRMESMRAWPLAPWKVFVGTLLPGVLLTSLVVAGMLATRGVLLRQFGADLWVTMALVPFLAYIWTSVDNAVFLLFPVRFVPGQGSALQHTGRGFLLVMLRGLLLVGALAIAAGGAYLLHAFVADGGFGRPKLALYLAGAWVALTAILLLTLLTAFGAWALRRFDVSRIPAPGA
ncbi:hypothetical protein Poly30_40490 [Planctomycetes bacterium Poly30]|uniref:Uncharacterized protein n=1 Tax=Saltatorellus ferox TaxID=2528018 RepID=A0A518EWR7_9BACT|nr:hypothetical protein Poly30_40490 [Planctomycetes bacterium Poly30]